MSNRFELFPTHRLEAGPSDEQATAERQLKALRYVIHSVNDDALRVWAELWEELKPGVTPGGMVLPEMSGGFTPPCGWAALLEKFWVLKHYLDCVQRFTKQTNVK